MSAFVWMLALTALALVVLVLAFDDGRDGVDLDELDRRRRLVEAMSRTEDTGGEP